MKKFWQIFGWALTLILQILLSLLLVELLSLWIVPASIETPRDFLLIPLTIWFSFLIGVFGIGILSLIIRKMAPYHTLIRLIGTLVMALIPMVLLGYLGLTIGLENQKEFQEVVMGKMVSYYTHLNLVFSLLGFYLLSWFNKLTPKKRALIVNQGSDHTA